MVEWFDKRPGSDIAKSQEDHMLLIGVGRPDWIRVPVETGHGGSYRCLELRLDHCPLPGHDHICLHYVLDGPVWCAECEPNDTFLWYARPDETTEQKS